jgi:broad specificity phosphatase PhoE
MNPEQQEIPSAVLRHIARTPPTRSVALLLRHSVRDALPAGDVGDLVPLTDIGRRLAFEFGTQLRGRLRTLHTSPLLRCTQTAEALAAGAGVELPIIPDRLLGDPGAFVLDGRRAWSNWVNLGHQGVMQHLVTEPGALPGMAKPDEAARFLVQHLLATAVGHPGLHVFVTHDSIVLPTAARLLRAPLGFEDWPGYLEGAFFWTESEVIHTAYRGHEAGRAGPLCSVADGDVVEFARREVAATVGLETGARFFLVGDAVTSLLTGRPARELVLWTVAAADRELLIEALGTRGARPAREPLRAQTFELAGRMIEVPREVEPTMVQELLRRVGQARSAVGAEHRPDDQWSAVVHPLADAPVSETWRR